MKKAFLILAILALCTSAAWAGPAPAVSTSESDLLAAIFETPQAQTLTTPTCVTQTQCSNGLWLGCNGYTGPDACETYRNCVMCDGKVYRCASGGFCPY
jgi:hypothetical protein